LTLTRSEELQKQSEQVVTFTLVELLTSLVFIAMLLALVLRSEALQNLDPSREHVLHLTQELEKTQKELKDAQREIAVLNDELEAQRSLVRRLMAQAGQPLPPNDVVVIPKGEWDKNRNAAEVSQEQLRQIQELLKQIAALKGGGSVTRPYCATNTGYLFTVQLNGDGTITPVPNWSEAANSEVAKVTGIGMMSGRMSQAAFAAAAARIDGWARSQEVPCAFRVRVTRSHENLPLYLRQLAVVEQHFYVTRAR
jgi:hypothetical protein